VRENIELYGLPDEEQYIEILIGEFGAAKHPSQADAYILESLPFYAPGLVGDQLSALSFSHSPLPDSLIEVLVDQTDLFRDDILVRWTQE
jgi:hypothetical protein